MRTPTLNFNPHQTSRPYWFGMEPTKQRTEYIEIQRIDIFDGDTISHLDILKDLEENEEVILYISSDFDGNESYELVRRQRNQYNDPEYDAKMEKYANERAKFEERLAQYEFDLAHYNDNKQKTARQIEIETLRRLALKYPEEFAK